MLVVASIFAQTREDTLIHVLPVMGSPEQALFFKENFDMEIAAASYAITQNASEADYLFRLSVSPNMVLYDDGTSEQAPPDEPQFLLNVSLIRGEDDAEIVSFQFPFTDLEEMYEHNLYLVYGAMANVPVTKLGEVVDESDRWRNKWLYIRTSFDYPVVTTHQSRVPGGFIYNQGGDQLIQIDHKVRAMPGVTVGAELQFLHWMSTEAGFLLRFGDPLGDTFIPGVYLQLKTPLKPSRHFMLEPYLMFHTQTNTAVIYERFPQTAIGGGFQFGVKGGEMGALFADISFSYTMGSVIAKNPMNDWLPSTLPYSRYVIAFGFGYKVGFMDRPPYIPRQRNPNPNP